MDIQRCEDRFVIRHGHVGTYGPNESDENRRILERALMQIGAAAAGFPETMTIELIKEPDAIRSMSIAPKDGSRILVWVRHRNWQYASDDEDRARWEGWVIASWTDFNGGGWTWHGHCGEFLGWLPLPALDLPKETNNGN